MRKTKGPYHASGLNFHKQKLNFFLAQNENGIFIPLPNQVLQIVYHGDTDAHMWLACKIAFSQWGLVRNWSWKLALRPISKIVQSAGIWFLVCFGIESKWYRILAEFNYQSWIFEACLKPCGNWISKRAWYGPLTPLNAIFSWENFGHQIQPF